MLEKRKLAAKIQHPELSCTAREVTMANTKALKRAERKENKRVARRSLKKTFAGFTCEQRSDYTKKPKGGVKGFLLGTNEELD